MFNPAKCEFLRVSCRQVKSSLHTIETIIKQVEHEPWGHYVYRPKTELA